MSDERTSQGSIEEWLSRAGEARNASEVNELLGLSERDLETLERDGVVLALSTAEARYFPTWQFDLGSTEPSIRLVTSQIVTAFRQEIDDISPYVIAAWATSPQPELADQTPAEWIKAGGEDAPVVLAAQRAAHLEAA
ncbi:MAG: hypothetical protein ACE37B_10935 [Ilumatobacter sp.]|uniref:hypothetical protein n=1 Tax=Ilumatobacter sp. TaxID=1967498 RepID=UPI0039199003